MTLSVEVVKYLFSNENGGHDYEKGTYIGCPLGKSHFSTAVGAKYHCKTHGQCVGIVYLSQVYEKDYSGKVAGKIQCSGVGRGSKKIKANA